jgi:hypothetical protein
MNNQDAEHLKLLSVFHYVCAGLAALFACFPVIHLVIGIAMVTQPGTFGRPGSHPPAFVGWFFILIAVVIITCGWIFAALLAWAGRCLSQRKHYMFCFVMAAVSCMFMPFGTVLGVFTILVLVRPSVKTLFEAHQQPPVAP